MDPIKEQRIVIARTPHIPGTGTSKPRSTGGSKAAPRSPTSRRRGSRNPIDRAIVVPDIVRDIRVKIASEPGEWEQAFRLMAAKDRARGYDTPGSPPYRFTPHHALPETVNLVAKHGDRVVAALSLIPDTARLGLPMESIYAAEVARLRCQGRRLAEATGLADEGLTLREFVRVFRALIRLAMQYHVSRGGDSWVIAVHPRHRDFYQQVVGLVPLGSCRAYPAVQGHPAEAYILDVELMKVHAPEMHREVFGEPLPEHVLAAPDWSPEWVRHFGGRSSQADRQAIEAVLRVVEHPGGLRPR
jgi:hypothetical protein